MKAPLLVLATTTLALLPATGFADEWNKHWSVSGRPELQVTTGDAAVEIEAGDSGAIEAVVRTKGYTIGGSGVRIEEHQNGNRVELEVREPRMNFGFGGFGNRELKVMLRVPRELTALLHTGDGPIRVSGVHGSIHATTGDGPVRVTGFAGTLDAKTGDGPVTLEGRFDDLRVQTGDGPVEISAEHGSKIATAWHLQTGDGPVNVRIPGDLSANLELHSGDGPIHVDLPLSGRDNEDHHNLHGALNGGGPQVSIHTGDGPISIGRS